MPWPPLPPSRSSSSSPFSSGGCDERDDQGLRLLDAEAEAGALVVGLAGEGAGGAARAVHAPLPDRPRLRLAGQPAAGQEALMDFFAPGVPAPQGSKNPWGGE